MYSDSTEDEECSCSSLLGEDGGERVRGGRDKGEEVEGSGGDEDSIKKAKLISYRLKVVNQSSHGTV